MLSQSEIRKRLARIDQMDPVGAASTILMGAVMFVEKPPYSRLDQAVLAWARKTAFDA